MRTQWTLTLDRAEGAEEFRELVSRKLLEAERGNPALHECVVSTGSDQNIVLIEATCEVEEHGGSGAEAIAGVITSASLDAGVLSSGLNITLTNVDVKVHGSISTG